MSIRFVVLIVGLLTSALTHAAADPGRPNILLILADDAGYADFGFQGSRNFRTPNLDALAEQGMRFEQAYVTAAVCGPSRAGLLTGKYQQRFGYEENNVPGYMSASGTTGDDMGLPLDELTIGDHLRSLGYETVFIGKWHQGNADRFHPLKRGFDAFYGIRGGARSYFPFDENNVNYRPEDYLERDLGRFEESDSYLTDALADEAIDRIRAEREQPLFMFLSLTAVHTPMDALAEDLDAFPDLEGDRRTLAAMTLSMDRAIGRVLDALDEEQVAENTIVVFTNDNGGPSDANASDNSPLSGTKANHLEGGIRVPFLIRWPGVIAKDTVYTHPISTLDLLPTMYAAARGEPGKLDGIDGVNIRPFLTNDDAGRPHHTLYWKKEVRAAIRDGDWKLLRFPDRPAELYDISVDAAETNNLAGEYPERVANLYRKLFEWELTLERPRWQLQRKYEGDAMKRMDNYRRINDNRGTDNEKLLVNPDGSCDRECDRQSE
ncbi:MAG: sulfatase [Woeseiaceae bacterium]